MYINIIVVHLIYIYTFSIVSRCYRRSFELRHVLRLLLHRHGHLAVGVDEDVQGIHQARRTSHGHG